MQSEPENPTATDPTSRVLAGITTLILAYVIALCLGGPQYATQLVVSQETDHEADHGFAPLRTNHGHETTGHQDEPHRDAVHPKLGIPGMVWVAPFGVLLLSIAILPLLEQLSRASHTPTRMGLGKSMSLYCVLPAHKP